MGTNVDGAIWRKSSFSGGNGGGCVEVARNLPGVVAVRDTKNRDGGMLIFTDAEWAAFIGGVKDGEFDLPGEPNDARVGGAYVAPPTHSASPHRSVHRRHDGLQ